MLDGTRRKSTQSTNNFTDLSFIQYTNTTYLLNSVGHNVIN